MTMSLSLARVALAAGLCLAGNALAQDVAPGVGGEMPQIEMPKAPDIAKDFTDAMKTPEAVKAAEEALKKTAKAYRDAKSFSDTVEISFEIMGQKQSQGLAIARDEKGARLEMGPMSIVSCNGKVYLTSQDAPKKFVAYPLDGSISKTLGKELGGFELPIPSWLLDPSETADLATELAGKILPGAKITGFDAAGGKVLVSGEGASVGVFSIDGKSSLLSGAKVNMAPPGAPEGFMIPLTISMKPSTDALKTAIAFDEAGQKANGGYIEPSL
jgi:hypothetical protein